MEVRNKLKKDISSKLCEIDKCIDNGQGSTSDVENRVQLTKLLLDINRKESLDLAQKAKVKWAIEGDENSKYFHGIINKKRRHLTVRGILIDEEWVDSPDRVKQEFYNYFATRFQVPDWSRPFTIEEFPRRLTPDQIPSNAEIEPFKEGEVVPTPPPAALTPSLSPFICHRKKVVPIIQPIHRIPFGSIQA
ncbi:hypothetical protein CTI12_AA518650 [Artemisia annua]|uniref:RNA-directed DNA polymerase, eukaryota n=1 Tax=Artemisia annua TaxID=35608 RepID=A0A2U1L8Q6_ARTAN|nr:hypothetical protein CTI12_AA518650 [Artemisia annua]